MSAPHDTTLEPMLSQRFPRRASAWRLRTRSLALPRRPRIMGVVNVTPDSFSDGGRYFQSERAVEHALRLAEEGADILDIGGESTRPYADPVDAAEELRRVLPVLRSLSRQTPVPLSIDTTKAAVAREALALGAEIINDVSGLERDPEMVAAAVEGEAAVCVMHMRGDPRTMQDGPAYGDVVEEIAQYLGRRRGALIEAGVRPDRICLDPGIGFGKTAGHNLTLMARCGRYHELGCPLLAGPSRKSVLGVVLGDPQADRGAATIGAALALARQGVQTLRVHDVRSVRDALLAFEASGGIDGRESACSP